MKVAVVVPGALPCGCRPLEERYCPEGERLLAQAKELLLLARQAETWGPWQAEDRAWKVFRRHLILV